MKKNLGKTEAWFVIGVNLAVFLALSPHAKADELSTYVNTEIQEMQTEVQNELAMTEKKIADLQSSKEKVTTETRKLGDSEKNAVDLLRNYNAVIVGRYVNEQGEYQDGLKLIPKDLKFVNMAFDKYLHMTPLQQGASAGEARRTIEWGMKRLTELAQIHSQPTEANNSDLEIISHDLKVAEKARKQYTELASRLKTAGSQSEFADNGSRRRIPASVKTTTKEQQ